MPESCDIFVILQVIYGLFWDFCDIFPFLLTDVQIGNGMGNDFDFVASRILTDEGRW